MALRQWLEGRATSGKPAGARADLAAGSSRWWSCSIRFTRVREWIVSKSVSGRHAANQVPSRFAIRKSHRRFFQDYFVDGMTDALITNLTSSGLCA